MDLGRKTLIVLAVAALPVLASCSSSTTSPPPPSTTRTYYSTFNTTALSAQIGVLPYPLTSSSTLIATVSNTASNGVLTTGPMAFDASGRLFATDSNPSPNVINVFTTLPLTSASTPAFVLTLPATYTSTTYGIAFDASGNLWVSNKAGVIDEFTGPFTTSATLVAALSLTIGLCAGPEGVTFDATGNLWVACEIENTGTNAVAEYLKGAGFTNGQAVDHFLNGPVHPVGIGFDASGNLYVGSRNVSPTGGVAQYISSNLGSGATPNVYDSTGMGTTPFPYQLVFDAAHNLYVADCGSSPAVYVFPTGTTAFSATLAPSVTYTDANIAANTCAAGVAIH